MKKINFDEKISIKDKYWRVCCKNKRNNKIIDTENLESKVTKAPNKNDVCEVIIHSSQLIPMDDFNILTKTARFCLLDENEIIAGGITCLKNYPDQREPNYNPDIKPINFDVLKLIEPQDLITDLVLYG